MINSVKLREFLKKNYIGLLLIGLLFFVVIFSISTLTTKPKFWIDEALTVELARNLSESGVLDFQVSPGKFSGLPYLLQSTGYPLISILALAFDFFGFTLTTERLVMLLLMIMCLLVLFFFGKKIFNKETAFLSVLLFASFASFYGSGRTAVGEIPGFIFLFFGLYFWLTKNSYYWTGIFFGLAIVTKPSVFLLVVPTITLVLLLENKDFFKKIFKIGLGILPALAGWIFLVLEHPFLRSTWQEIINFYKNPYGGEIASNVAANLSGFFHSTTLVYFGILFLLVFLSRYWIAEQKIRSLFDFVIFYSIIAFIYYLRSPGWLRYILIAELLILFLIPSSLLIIFSKLKEFWSRISINSEKLAMIVILFFTVIQFTNLFTSAQIYSSDSAIKTAGFINEKFPKASVGIIDSFEVSALLQTTKKYQSLQLLGIPKISSNFILNSSKPDIIVFSSGIELTADESSVIDSYYNKFVNMNGYEIYNIKEGFNK